MNSIVPSSKPKTSFMYSFYKPGRKIISAIPMGAPFVLRRPEELESLRDLWEPLQWNPYSDLEYLLWKYGLADGFEEPHVIPFHTEDGSCLIVAGEKKVIPIQFQIGYKRWEGPSLKTFYIHRWGLLGQAGTKQWKALEAYIEGLLLSGEVEAVLLRDFDLHCFPHTLNFSKIPAPCKYRVGIVQEHWQVDGGGGLKPHRSRHRSFWHNVRNRSNRFLRGLADKVELKTLERPEELHELVTHTEEVACKTWQRRLGAQEFTCPEVKERYGYLMGRGLLKGNILFLDEKPAAFFHGLKYVGNFYAETMGYDPAYSNLGVGTYLTGKVLESLLQEGEDGFIDFGVGNSESKGHFCDKYFKTKDIFLVAPTARLMALNTLRAIFLSLHLSLKKALSKGGLYHQVRSFWRYGAGRKGTTKA